MSKSNKQVELFRTQKEYVLKYIATHGVGKITLYSATTFIPLIAIYTFLMEDYPEHKDLCLQKLKELEEFYGF